MMEGERGGTGAEGQTAASIPMQKIEKMREGIYKCSEVRERVKNFPSFFLRTHTYVQLDLRRREGEKYRENDRVCRCGKREILDLVVFAALPGILAVIIGVGAIFIVGGGRLVLGLEPEPVDCDSCSTNDGGNDQCGCQESGIDLDQAGGEVDKEGPGLITGQRQITVKILC
jgi:hypothetical protein